MGSEIKSPGTIAIVKIIQVFFNECLIISVSLHNPHTSFVVLLHPESFSEELDRWGSLGRR